MANSRGTVAALLCLALALGGAGCRKESASRSAGAPERAPAFELKDLSGKTVRLSDFSGKVVLLDFWATYCGPCHESIPVFERLYEENKGSGLEVVGISLDAFADQVPAFVKELGMKYAVVLDPENSAQRAYGVRGLPTSLLIDRRGIIRQEWVGFDETVAAEIRAEVRAALQEKASS